MVSDQIKHKVITKSKACGFHCIRVNGFTVKIGGNIIVEDVNLHIHCGQLTTIIGRNGAGKSTLLKAILDQIKHEGHIEFKHTKSNALSKIKIGYVPQYLNIAKNTPTSVYDLFASYITKVPIFLIKSKKVSHIIKEQLSQFEADHLIDKAVCDLSGGELQRVLLSIATYQEPNLLVLDEPVSGIDKTGMELFYKNINELKRQYDLAIILVSHDLEYVEKYADYVVLLDKRIIKEGKPKEVFESKEFYQAFGYHGGNREDELSI